MMTELPVFLVRTGWRINHLQPGDKVEYWGYHPPKGYQRFVLLVDERGTERRCEVLSKDPLDWDGDVYAFNLRVACNDE